MDRELHEITGKVLDFIAKGDESETSRARFEELALEIYAFQYRAIGPYRTLCQRRGKTPATTKSWKEIPAVPADAFKQFLLFAGPSESVVKTFRSSGTTDSKNSSKSLFSDAGLELMNQSVIVNARRMLFSDGRRPRVLALAPSPELAPQMIMVHGMNQMIGVFGDEGSRFCIGAQGLDVSSVLDELRRCEERAIPVTLMGSSFGFVHLFDAMEERGVRIALADGSRLMDAGGYKGRSREIERAEFVKWACAMLGLIPSRVLNLLGMTELASQIYDRPIALSAGEEISTTPKKPPHWVRTRIVDPADFEFGDLREISDASSPGLLRHLDLANVERPMVVQSDDIGVWTDVGKESGFEILGRARGSEPRGCSLSAEDFKRSQSIQGAAR